VANRETFVAGASDSNQPLHRTLGLHAHSLQPPASTKAKGKGKGKGKKKAKTKTAESEMPSNFT
jgi:hypothetical protein